MGEGRERDERAMVEEGERKERDGRGEGEGRERDERAMVEEGEGRERGGREMREQW